MTVNHVGGGSTPVAKSPAQGLAANFDNFLKLLTTQLQKQDPLAPMDAASFTSQLVEFASVEQAIQANTRLAELSRLKGELAAMRSRYTDEHPDIRALVSRIARLERTLAELVSEWRAHEQR